MAGVEFLWSIGNADKRTQSDNKIPGNVLRFLTYQESQYETPLTVVELDAAGKKGHVVLLEGIRTGTAKVNNLIHIYMQNYKLNFTYVFLLGFCKVTLSRV